MVQDNLEAFVLTVTEKSILSKIKYRTAINRLVQKSKTPNKLY